jgi:hypothetical protein
MDGCHIRQCDHGEKLSLELRFDWHPEHVKMVRIGELRYWARYSGDTESGSELGLRPTYLAFQENFYVSKSTTSVRNLFCD